jgi:hypothetical protein
VKAVWVREHEWGRGKARADVVQRSGQLVGELFGFQLRKARVTPTVGRHHSPNRRKRLELIPGRDRLLESPRRRASNREGIDEDLRTKVTMRAQGVNSVAEGVIGRKNEAPRRKRNARIVLECDHLGWRQRSESKHSEEPKVLFETPNLKVEILVARPSSTADPVVIEDDVRATRESAPFLLRCAGANAEPERKIRREVEERGWHRCDSRNHPKPQERVSQGPSTPVGVKEAADLHLGEQRGIDPHQFNRGRSPRLTETKKSACVRQQVRLPPREFDTLATQPNGHRFGPRSAIRQ